MTYKRFEDLPVWQDAIRLAELAEDFLDAAGSKISRGKQDQLDRCSMSVSNNIAEGFERGTTNELLQFLYIARGSSGEVRSMMRFFDRRPKLAAVRDQIAEVGELAESCSRQIRAWADSLQNSDIKGQRHLNDEARSNFEKRKEAKKSREVFDEMMSKYYKGLPDGHPQKEEARRKGLI